MSLREYLDNRNLDTSRHSMQTYTHTHTSWGGLTLIERLMVFKMATARWHASSQTTRTQWRYRSSAVKRTAWLCRLEEERELQQIGKQPCNDCLGVFFSSSHAEYWYLQKTSHRTFSLKFAVLPVVWCSPHVGPRFSLNMIHGAVPSLSLINNETNSEEKKHWDITYSWDTCRIITVMGKDNFEHLKGYLENWDMSCQEI